MKPEAEAPLDTARLTLRKARACIMAVAQEPALAESAARDASYAAYHAAQALIIERADKYPETHSGVHSKVSRIAMQEPAISIDLRKFLVAAYSFKSTADYDTTPPQRVGIRTAETAVQSAETFVGTIAILLTT